MNKKIIWTLLVFLSFLGNIKAITFKGGDVIDNVFILKVKENGEKEYKKGQFIVDDLNNYVYCLDPFVKVNNSSTYDIHEDNFEKVLGMSDELWKKINLIIYYGYEYKDLKHDHSHPMWYYITQMLIWESVSPNSNFYFTDTFNGNINTSLFQKEKEEIMYLVNTHEETPLFSYPKANVGETIEAIDTKDVLYRFNPVTGVEKQEKNKITVKLYEKNNLIPVRKMSPSKAYLFTSSNSQTILKGRVDYPVRMTYNIKAKEPTGNIIIKKYGETYNKNNVFEKEVLKNVKFGLYDENKRLLKLSFTNIEGNIIFSELPKGTYYVKEISSLEGYEINSQYRQVILRENNYKINDINIEFINYLKRGDLTIKKVDASTGLPIKNVMFALLKDDVTIFEGVTNEAGILEVRGLTYGTYFIKEIKAPDGYVMIEDKIEINIDNVSKILEIKNELQYGNLVVKKVDYDSNLPIKNAKVAIFKDDITIFEGYTNEFGIIEVKNIPLGLYFVKEVEAPDGYVKNNQTYEVELIEHKKTEIVEIANELQKGNLIIKKIDATSEKELSKAEFLVFNDNKIIYYGPTKENGILELKNLALGTYYIKEVKSPHGYVLDDNIYEIHLVENNKTEVIIIKNELKKGNLTIKKVDGNTKKPLYNTEFIILKDNTIIYKGITNKDGILKIDNLTLGLYTIKEIKASNGYNINEEEISIIITDKENYIEITNERLIDKEDYIEIPNIPNTNVNGVEILLYYEDKNKMHKRDL
ncbi:MAG: Cys-Gln thioester bond-forming surface protein [Firmicutes bacterium]|nr:Cys-Gln thioester bond-forming surface protein [Bacillota bacterium]